MLPVSHQRHFPHDGIIFWTVRKNNHRISIVSLVAGEFPQEILATAQPGFTQIQQGVLSRCITNETNSLAPTPNY